MFVHIYIHITRNNENKDYVGYNNDNLIPEYYFKLGFCTKKSNIGTNLILWQLQNYSINTSMSSVFAAVAYVSKYYKLQKQATVKVYRYSFVR